MEAVIHQDIGHAGLGGSFGIANSASSIIVAVVAPHRDRAWCASPVDLECFPVELGYSPRGIVAPLGRNIIDDYSNRAAPETHDAVVGGQPMDFQGVNHCRPAARRLPIHSS